MSEDQQKPAPEGETSGPTVDRRQLVVGGAAVAVGLTAEQAAAKTPEEMWPQEGDRIQLSRGAHRGKLLKPEMLKLDAKQTEAFPFDPKNNVVRSKNRLNRMLILLLDADDMDDETREFSVDGIVAYSAICTHRGCTVKSWKKEEKHLRCHCHLSEWKALEKAAIVRGPAKRNLPIVPLGIDDEGYVITKGGFSAKPGGAKK